MVAYLSYRSFKMEFPFLAALCERGFKFQISIVGHILDGSHAFRCPSCLYALSTLFHVFPCGFSPRDPIFLMYSSYLYPYANKGFIQDLMLIHASVRGTSLRKLMVLRLLPSLNTVIIYMLLADDAFMSNRYPGYMLLSSALISGIGARFIINP